MATWEKLPQGYALRVQPDYGQTVEAGQVVPVTSFAKRAPVYRTLTRLISSNREGTVQFWESRAASYEEVRAYLYEA